VEGAAMGSLYLGTSGYTYKDWREIFYPKGLAQRNWLTFYAQRYNTVEINATFYRDFPQTVFQRWHMVTPPNFRFTLKGPRWITHEKHLSEIDDDLQTFVEHAHGLQEKLAVMLWQFPPSARVDDLYQPLAQFLPKLPGAVRQVFEFRHTSWFNETTYSLLNQHNAGFVINDSSRWPAREMQTGDFM
jgi:uncharacterized protein YecE (DUF72 family)